MALKVTATQRKALAEVLEAEHETLEDAVSAVLELLDEVVADRASFVVVGQLSATRERLSVPPSDPEAIKVALGFYSTDGDARSAAESLVFNAASGDSFRTWWLPMFHGTPAELHKKQKAKYEAAEARRKQVQAERIQKQIQEHQAEADERARLMREEEKAA